jgi:protein TonB
MKGLPLPNAKFRLLSDSSFSANGRLLKTGVFSLFLHSLLIFLLIFSMNPVHKKDGLVVYPVTLKIFPPEDESRPRVTRLPVPANTLIRKEENSWKQELKQKGDVLEKKNSHSEIHSPAQTVIPKVPPEEQKQPPRSQEKEQAPIPLPMGELSPSDKDSNSKMEDNLPVPLALFRHEEQKQNIILGTGYGEGPSQGSLGSGGAGDGSGTGRRGSESGSGQGGFGWGGSGKGAGIGGGPGGGGFGDGSGTGGGGSGGGGSGGYGTGVFLPKYAENPKPVYPQEAQAKGYKGKVLLRVQVLPNGHVGHIEVKESSGYEILDQSALSTVRKWKFIPAQKGGVVIQAWVNIPIKFDLQ